MTAGTRGRGAALVTLAALALAWGTNWPFMKLAFAELPIWGLRAWSCVIAGLIILAIARASGARLWTADPGE